ncbi:polysaccharide biosynthesis tyrosine autokinase [Clostridium tyrobutyricum]|uniref:non-specific protein-tyrosine kinase n=1 Tax=Clostridium tyrobutyricum DIVETGP TaxID=1408889 RepID=W6NJM0_CLOTY|nr:CpsD/CapB family tyrosine-protein kinase [Clostridium tyrobutyricum]AND83737.1 CPSC/CAPB subfamily ATPase [Clostridium tyrobutyricum]ANP68500.1 capsular biosynthesis protein [Clostridium tyrobutyricum]MBV4433789.1 CpsD/CapB family tyrosine-protein kinase [Clostridium tyrobutyricum]MEA5007107.1 CpsD/CapB family tyrosine-protein kinase [Clostridium tyrobutyricum]QNB67155.1 polysaccharide biosynthesis tyrosine autokinase [Clostridium tyrobutyricum]
MEKSELITIQDPKSPVSEAYRTLRTNIQFSSVDNEVQTIMITSSGPGEGKSTTSSNLAAVMAESGAETIIIDCDQRKPTLHKKFLVSNKKGLSDVLAGKAEFKDAVVSTGIDNLDLLTSGTKPPNPSGLLASRRMKTFIEELKEKYRYIIVDTPPVIAVTDAQIVSTYVDGCILVVASSQADRDAALKAKKLLEKVNANILGTVLNKVEAKGKGYYGYYYSYYDEDGNKQKKKKKK